MKHPRLRKITAAARNLEHKKTLMLLALTLIALVFAYFLSDEIAVEQSKSSLIEFASADDFDANIIDGEVVSATVTSQINMISEYLQIQISEGTVFTPKNGEAFEPTQLRVEASTFGISNRQIIFSKPVAVVISTPSIADGTEVHIGGGREITTNSTVTCTDGIASTNEVVGTISSGTITIYACAV